MVARRWRALAGSPGRHVAGSRVCGFVWSLRPTACRDCQADSQAGLRRCRRHTAPGWRHRQPRAAGFQGLSGPPGGDEGLVHHDRRQAVMAHRRPGPMDEESFFSITPTASSLRAAAHSATRPRNQCPGSRAPGGPRGAAQRRFRRCTAQHGLGKVVWRQPQEQEQEPTVRTPERRNADTGKPVSAFCSYRARGLAPQSITS